MSEARLQQEIVFWFRNKYPKLRGLLCYNNNNSTGSRRGKINKYLGVVKGRSDMVLYYNGKSFMFELKTDIGKQSPSQKEWQELVERQGFDYYIIRSLVKFQEAIFNIIPAELDGY
tara:strand:- start:3032 stop:3379 length:348 start_codon:yes stop_codon:yes gene_type:complete